MTPDYLLEKFSEENLAILSFKSRIPPFHVCIICVFIQCICAVLCMYTSVCVYVHVCMHAGVASCI